MLLLIASGRFTFRLLEIPITGSCDNLGQLDGCLVSVVEEENFAPLSNKKCSGLVAVGYSSWKKWAGNRCIVQSFHIPQDRSLSCGLGASAQEGFSKASAARETLFSHRFPPWQEAMKLLGWTLLATISKESCFDARVLACGRSQMLARGSLSISACA